MTLMQHIEPNEPDIYFVKYPTDVLFLGKPIELNILGRAAHHLCQHAGCDMRTFEYHGVVDAGPRPGEAEGRRAHLWSAMQGQRH